MLGAFQLTIPISGNEALLRPEERLLAWLKWKISVMPPARRWYRMLTRYAELVAGRVEGFGGDPGSIAPSPVGSIPGGHAHGLPHHHPGRERCYVGKVAALRYDSFGDFGGFTLRTESGP